MIQGRLGSRSDLFGCTGMRSVLHILFISNVDAWLDMEEYGSYWSASFSYSILSGLFCLLVKVRAVGAPLHKQTQQAEQDALTIS